MAFIAKPVSLFAGEVKKQLSIKGWNYGELAKATGYTKSTIQAFMVGDRDSDNVRSAIARALKIKESEET